MAASTAASATTHSAELNNGVLTTWMPLVTEFKPAEGCDKLLMKWDEDLVGWDPGYGVFVETESTGCHAEEMTSWWDQQHLSSNVDLSRTVYSIGPVVCPSPYATVNTILAQQTSTLVACCPTPYTHAGDKGLGIVGECRSPLTAGQVITYMKRYHKNLASTSGQPVETTTAWSRVTSTVQSARQTEYMFAIPVKGYLFPNSSTSLGSDATNNTNNPGSTGSSTPVNSDMSSGAKIGIGVGVGLGVVAAIAALAAFLLRRRSRAARTQAGDQNRHDDAHGYVPVQPATPRSEGYGWEAKTNTTSPSVPASEMYAGGNSLSQGQYHEMPTAAQRAELA